MNKEKSDDFLTYEELSNAVDTEKEDNSFRTAAEFLMQAVTDWSTLDLLEPKDLIEEIRNEVQSKLTFDNLEAFSRQLDFKDDNAIWKKESVNSLLELFDSERKNMFDKETDLVAIIKKLTDYYRK